MKRTKLAAVIALGTIIIIPTIWLIVRTCFFVYAVQGMLQKILLSYFLLASFAFTFVAELLLIKKCYDLLFPTLETMRKRTLARLRRTLRPRTLEEYTLLFPNACRRCGSKTFLYRQSYYQPQSEKYAHWSNAATSRFCDRCMAGDNWLTVGESFLKNICGEEIGQVEESVFEGGKKRTREIRESLVSPYLKPEQSLAIPDWPWDGVSLDPADWFVDCNGKQVPSPKRAESEYPPQVSSAFCKTCNSLQVITTWINCCKPDDLGTKAQWGSFRWSGLRYHCKQCTNQIDRPAHFSILDAEEIISDHDPLTYLFADEYPKTYKMLKVNFTLQIQPPFESQERQAVLGLS